MGFIGEEEELVRRVYEDPFAEPAPWVPIVQPDTEPAQTPAVPVPA